MEGDERGDCCVACHLSWEEQYALPFLPGKHQRALLREHRIMREWRAKSGEWPLALLLEHAEKEDRLFPQFLPPYVLAKMEHEHQILEYKIRNGLPLDD